MHEFHYKNSILYCENIPLTDIVKKYPTPFYLYSYRTLMDHFHKIQEAFKEVSPLICFSMKSNSNLSMCKALVNAGAGSSLTL